MNAKIKNDGILCLPEELHKRKRIILGELKDRTLWFVRLRWWVPPSIAVGVAAARLIGVEFAATQLLFVAAFILVYNIIFHYLARGVEGEAGVKAEYIQRFTYAQVGLDYVAMFLLIHFSGGAASPLIFFFIFHIIFTAILLPPRWAYVFSAAIAVGMCIVSGAEYLGIISHHSLVFLGREINLSQEPYHVAVELGFFSASVFITAFSTTSIMTMLRKRILDLADLSEAVSDLNNKLNSLYAMVQAIGSIRNLSQLLHIVTSELADVMDVKAISVKLLTEDGKALNYAAAYGLPDELIKNKVIEVLKSQINRKIIEGEAFITGKITEKEMFQFGEDLAAVGLKSVLFVPLKVEDRIIGILGAYCVREERFGGEEVDFFRLAGGLVAIAIENARSYEAIEKLIQERSRFMTRVAHNLRAPLAAMVSILDVVRDGYVGELNDAQKEHLRRVDRRAKTMMSLISELMTLAQSRSEKRKLNYQYIDLKYVAGRLQRTFEESATEKKIVFLITTPDDIPEIWGDLTMIEHLLENLVSNAIKYTPSGGKVGVTFSYGANGAVRIEIKDNGIGIPKDDMPKLFNEFFRAENARSIEEIGTGLGLAIVKEIVDLHGGRIRIESEEGLGTIFVVQLPIARKEISE